MTTRAWQGLAREPNEAWHLDVGYTSAHEKRFSVLCVVDEVARKCLAVEIRETFHGQDVVRVLARLASAGGAPGALIVDARDLFSDAAIVDWAARDGTQVLRLSVHAPLGKGAIERAIRSAGANLPGYDTTSPPGRDATEDRPPGGLARRRSAQRMLWKAAMEANLR